MSDYGDSTQPSQPVMELLVRLDERGKVILAHLERINGRLDRGEERTQSLETTRSEWRGAQAAAVVTWRALFGLVAAASAVATFLTFLIVQVWPRLH